jgi:ATP-dependent helicase/nuclease subunit A
MKARLIRELSRLSAGQASKHLEQLSAALSLPESVIRTRAASILQKILHTYSRFYVGTIDSFFQQVIRSFTREMGIQTGYTVELDTEFVLDDAIDRLQIETSENKHLLHWLTDFALDRIEKGSSWNFRKDITKLGQQLFNEQFKTFSNMLSGQIADKDFMVACQQEFARIKKKFENTIRQMATGGMDCIRSAGLEPRDFFQRDSGPAGFLLKISAGNMIEPNSYVRKATEAISGWYSKNSDRKSAIEKACQDGLFKTLQEVVSYYDRESPDYYTADLVLKNIYTLGILTDLSGHLQDYCKENNIFLLSEASYFLNQVIDNNDAPFVYEKTGNHFHHFMIDEFQDTSLLQWKNFKPLISNSLSQNYDNLIVGDVKQSIYRWRNSNWEILANAVADEFYSQSLNFETLKYNHRSCRDIVLFNNTVFREASCLIQDHFDKQSQDAGINLPDYLNGSVIRNFADAVQVTGQTDHKEGTIKLVFLAKESYETAIKEQLLSLINELFEKGYSAGDIAILTRKNEEAKTITDFFISLKNAAGPFQHPFNVISDETLYLSNSSAIRFLISFIRYFYYPEDQINKYFLVSEFIRYLLPEEEGTIHKPLLDTPDFSAISVDSIFPGNFQLLLTNAGSLSLFELTENLISLFRLNEAEGEAVYLQAFQDLILDFTHRRSSSASDFLEYWDERGYKKPVILPGNPNAIRVLTIHKAKGLEFPVVILPYCSWKLADQSNRPLLWCKPQHSPFNKLSAVPVEFVSKLSQTRFAVDYFEELLKQYIDALNLLYVAFTRASKAIYGFAQLPGKDQFNNVSDLLLKLVTKDKDPAGNQDTINLNQYYRSEDHIFEYGELTGNFSREDLADSTSLLLTRYPVSDVKDHLKIAFQGNISVDAETGEISRPVSEGSLMHDIFSRILHHEDIPEVLNKMALEGKIQASQVVELTSFIKRLLADNRVNKWFSDDWQVITETEFVLPDGSVKRPDRILIRDDRVVIIDYKFGRLMDTRHEKQLLEYRELLLKMGYKNAEAWLWYVMLDKVEQVG